MELVSPDERVLTSMVLEGDGRWKPFMTARYRRPLAVSAHVASPAGVTLRLATRYAVATRRVFDAWLEPAFAAQWLFARALRPLAHAEIDARVSGAFRLVEVATGTPIVHRGEYVAIDPPSRLVFTLHLGGTPVATRVTVRLDGVRGGCVLRLRHDGVPVHDAERLADRWTGLLYGLGTLLDADAPPLPRGTRDEVRLSRLHG